MSIYVNTTSYMSLFIDWNYHLKRTLLQWTGRDHEWPISIYVAVISYHKSMYNREEIGVCVRSFFHFNHKFCFFLDVTSETPKREQDWKIGDGKEGRRLVREQTGAVEGDQGTLQITEFHASANALFAQCPDNNW